MKKIVLTTFSFLLLPLCVMATTIGVNFTDAGTVDSTMLAGEVAGAPGVAASNWNNVAAAAAGSGIALPLYDDGSATPGATIDFTTDLGNWRLGHAVANGDDRMWKGYLDVNNSASVTVNNHGFVGPYDVHVYFDGSNGAGWRVAEFTIGGTTLSGEDSENTNWGTGQNTGFVYQQPVAGAGGNQPFPNSPNNNEGNYVLFSGVTGSSFTIDVLGGANNGQARAPINGFQIVGTTIPEPSSAFLLLVGGLLLVRRLSPCIGR